ncbi:hypothetical protein [uncultured Xanthomonas sp.]|uniref:hypothetical protein n=1 Tax=uncultured Xanthomonas sp. TaxID=152831 RepID=UPI0025DA9086|nr:hypothetical protein [uncultured Xanthomonas sp.]MCW0368107.1 hypothetical protein [Xanthomonas sacchari]MCW0442265.1 hypothetical protein [Xanthomonas sacchari]
MQALSTTTPRWGGFTRLPWGLLLLVLWSIWAASQLVALARPPPADSAAAIRARLLAFAPAIDAADGQPVAFRLRVAGCECAAPAALALPGMRSVDLRARLAPPSLPYALIVLDAQSRLIYAGPAQLAGCGTSIAAASLLPRLLATGGASPLISPAQCGCPTDSKESLS